MGYPMKYDNTQQIWDELRQLCPNFFGATYEKMGELGYVQWPCRDESEADQWHFVSVCGALLNAERAGAVLHL